MHDGYDQDYEDRLFEQIEWPRRRLPAVRHRPLHRRPRLVRRRVGEQLHLRPAHAARAGRARSTRASRCPAAATPTSSSTSARRPRRASTVVTILGEGSFHQVHGGTTTNYDRVGRAPRPLGRLRRALRRAAGHGVQGPGQGRSTTSARCPDAARRTKRAAHGRAASTSQLGARRRARRAPDAADPRARGAADGVRRRLLAQPARGSRRRWLGQRGPPGPRPT